MKHPNSTWFLSLSKGEKGKICSLFCGFTVMSIFQEENKQKKSTNPTRTACLSFRMPSWNGTVNYLILCMWALVPCGGEYCSPVSRIKSTLKDNSSCPSSRRAQPEKKGVFKLHWDGRLQAPSAVQWEARGPGPALVHFPLTVPASGDPGFQLQEGLIHYWPFSKAHTKCWTRSTGLKHSGLE